MAEVSVAPAVAVAPEKILAGDLARRALLVSPLFVVIGAIFWGLDGVLSTLFALVLVVANFVVSARLSARAARISLTALMATVLLGYPLRLALIAAATFAVRNAGWFSPVPWGFSLIIAHLGLLAWEATQVSATLAFPALKPKPARPARSGRGPLSFRPGKGL